MISVQKIKEFALDIIFTHAVQIHEQHAGIEISVVSYAESQLRIVTEKLCACYNRIRNDAEQIASELCIKKLCDIIIENDIGIYIYRFVKFGKHFRDENAVIYRRSIIIAKAHFAEDGSHLFCHGNKFGFNIFSCHCCYFSRHFSTHAVAENVNMIFSLIVGMKYQ